MSPRDVAVFPVLGAQVVHDPRGDGVLGYVRAWSYDLLRTPSVFGHEAMQGQREPSIILVIGSRAEIEVALGDLQAGVTDALHVEAYAVKRVPPTPYAPTPPSDQWALSIRSGSADKASALRWIAQYLGVAMEDTVAVGDWLNDRAMLEAAGRSFAMHGAPEVVKAAATDVLSEGEHVMHALTRALEKCV